jgi:RNA polymerase sigma-70 factor (ECF subfamily)
MTMAAPLPATRPELHAQLLAAMEQEHARAFALALRLVGNDADARDALQDAWVRAWRARDQFRDGGKAGPWLRAIVVRECMRALRWRAVRRWLPLGPAVPDPPADLPATGDRLDAARVRRTLATLPAQQRVVFALRFEEGWTVPEIADSLGVGVETVKTHLSRALARVRADLGAADAL